MFGNQDEARGDGVSGIDPGAASDLELAERALAIERERTRLDAEQALVLAELEARQVTDRLFLLRTGTWLAHEAKLPAGQARDRVKVAAKLRRYFPEVAAALGAGWIGWEHVRVIVGLANPRIIDVVVENQQMLIGLADRCRFEQWAADVRGLARMWDQDGSYDPNEDPARNKLTYATTLDGLLSIAVTLTGDNAEVVRQALEARTDELNLAAVRDHEICPDLEVPARSQLRAEALTGLIRQALGVDVGSSRGPKTEVTLTVDADEPTVATNPEGVRLADGTTRVLLCDAEVHALVVDRLGVPLDLARHVRWADEHQRRAARRRDGGCVFPGCDARVTWCDVHHCVHWDDDGVSDLCNLVCLCRRHHGITHRKGWAVRLDADGWAIFQAPSGLTFWGQRHGRVRAGPPPDPLFDPGEPGADARFRKPDRGKHVVPGRFNRIEDPVAIAHARQLLRRCLADLRNRAA